MTKMPGGGDYSPNQPDRDATNDEPPARGLLGYDADRQQRQDMAVVQELLRIERSGRLPEGRDIHFVLCGDPAAEGVSDEEMALVERAAYESAGYGHRAEGLALFRDGRVFRGYTEHGPLRHVLVIERGSESWVLGFLLYFEVNGFAQLGPDFAHATERLAQNSPELRTIDVVVSKLVTSPDRPTASAGLVGLGGLVLAAVLRGLASTNPDGIVVGARTQADSQKLIRRFLPVLVPGMNLLLDREIQGEGEGGAQAHMLAHIAIAVAK